MRLAIIASHPIQYQAPLFRELARRVDLTVFFAHRATPIDQANAGFGVGFNWDVNLLSDYEYVFLTNVARNPGLENFAGCDTPELGRLLAGGRFDAVLVMGWHLKSFIQALIAAKRLGMPIMARGDSHLQTPRAAIKKIVKELAYPGFLRLFDAALYVGQRSRTYWRHYRYPSARLFFAPHCVDAEWFASRATTDARFALRTRIGLAPDRKVAMFAGKLVSFKRPLDLVAAVTRLRCQGANISVLVAGSGPLRLEIECAARVAGVPCHMLGFCNYSEMPAAYSASDILVLPSDETWGLVANEALACGRPIVVCDAVGCAPDLAGDGQAGRIFPAHDIGALAAVLADVMDHPPTTAAIAAKSSAYSLAAAADGIVQAANFTLSNRRPDSPYDATSGLSL